ncbi:MAG: L-fucose:H+ symporter permease [Tannerella sp.]|jgi:FHS family L-fucose permease-like MFS transporter|nr:L-fucose:H+ symporter permease [Tannerella sp.]
MNNSKPKLIASGYVFTFALVATLFFMWALPNILNDVLIKQFQKSLELTRFQAGFIQTAIKFGYFCLAIPAGLFMQRFGYKQGILTGLLTFAIGCFLFYPAASSQIYLVFLCAIFIIGGGLSFLELGANSFVTGLGDPSTAARRLNFAQSFNPIGSIFAASLGTHFIFSGKEPSLDEIAIMKSQITATGNAYTDFLQTENSRVWPTYFAIGILVLLVAVLIWRAKFPTIASSEISSSGEQKGSYKKLFKFPHWYGAIISQFFYLGAQLGTWSYLITYVQENSQMNEKQAGGLLIINMVIFMAGRFFATYVMKWIQATRLMGFYALVNIGLILIVIFGSKWASWTGIHGISHWIGICAMMSTTFFMSLMYPTNFASGIKGLGPHTKIGASILVMSLIGGALLTPLIGLIADSSWAHAVAPGMVIPLISYLVISWYGFYGSRPRGPLYN